MVPVVVRQSKMKFIPKEPAVLCEWTKGVMNYITPERAEQWSISNYMMSELREKATRFIDIQTNLEEPIGRAEHQQLHRAKRELIAIMHNVIRLYFRRSVVSSEDLMAMDIPVVIRSKTPQLTVEEEVETNIRVGRHNCIIVDFWIAGNTTSKVKPRGYKGAIIVWAISETEPELDDEYIYQTLAPFRVKLLKFDKSLVGKRVWIKVKWQNARGISGKFCKAKSAIIP